MIRKDEVISVLKSVYDPELGLNVVDLGLVYDITIDAGGVKLTMTLTTPFCPVAPQFVAQVEDKIKSLGVANVKVELVWDPPWSTNRMSDEARMELGLI